MLRSPRRPGSSFCRKLTTLPASSQRNLMVKTNAMMETVIPPAARRKEAKEIVLLRSVFVRERKPALPTRISTANTGLTNHVKHEVPYQEAQCHSTAKNESSRWKDKHKMCQWILKQQILNLQHKPGCLCFIFFLNILFYDYISLCMCMCQEMWMT